MGRVRQAYGLNGNEVEKTIQVLWPEAVFPVELWSKVHEAYWRAFADSNQAVYKIESPALPDVDTTQKFFHTYLCSVDVMTFFRKLSLNIKAKILREGLKYILEETYEDIDAVYPEEREFLFNTLSRLEAVDVFDQYSPDSELFEEKILGLPASSYHFISHIFPETVVVDKIAAIYYWSVIRNCPLCNEVKGITHDLVRYVIKEAAQGTLQLPKSTLAQGEAATALLPNSQRILSLPRSFWAGKTQEYICSALREKGWDNLEIAHVLFHKRGFTQKRAIARLLHENSNLTDSAYDKYGKTLFEDSKPLDIIDEDSL